MLAMCVFCMIVFDQNSDSLSNVFYSSSQACLSNIHNFQHCHHQFCTKQNQQLNPPNTANKNNSFIVIKIFQVRSTGLLVLFLVWKRGELRGRSVLSIHQFPLVWKLCSFTPRTSMQQNFYLYLRFFVFSFFLLVVFLRCCCCCGFEFSREIFAFLKTKMK